MAALCGYYNVPLVEILTGHPAPPPPQADQPAAAATDVAAAQQTRALRRLTASVASRRTGTDAPVDGAPRLRHGDYEVLALALNTTPARLQQLAAQAKPRPCGTPVPPVPGALNSPASA